MRKEITFDEYMSAMQIVKAYERQRRTPFKDEKEIERIKEIKQLALKFIDTFGCSSQQGRYEHVKYYRFAISHWLRTNTNFSLQYIGNFLGGYNHATILHHIKEYNREASLSISNQHELHRDSVVQIEKYLGHLTKNNFKNLEPAISELDNEGSFFISNN